MSKPTPDAVRIGTALRGARAAARLTQAQVGDACGYSASGISRIESGELQPAWPVILQIADVVGLPRHMLDGPSVERGGADASASARGQATLTGRASDREDAVRRRDFVAGALGLGATLAVGPGTPAAHAAAVPAGDPQDAIERALFQPETAPPLTLETLTARLGRGRVDFRAARYLQLGEALPDLIAGATATVGAARGSMLDQAQAALARAYVIAAELAVKYHQGAAWAAADRALAAARASGDPVVLGEAARMLAITMRRAGRAQGATEFLIRTAESLDADRGDASAEAIAVRTSLLLTAGYSAAQAHQRGTAESLLDAAEETAARVPADRRLPLFTVDANPLQVDLYRIGAATALGVPEQGVKAMSRVNPALLSTTERRARFYTDTARMWHALGEDRKAFGALRAIEQVAPEEVRRPGLRALTADLVYGPAGSAPEVVAFARRTGALLEA